MKLLPEGYRSLDGSRARCRGALYAVLAGCLFLGLFLASLHGLSPLVADPLPPSPDLVYEQDIPTSKVSAERRELRWAASSGQGCARAPPR